MAECDFMKAEVDPVGLDHQHILVDRQRCPSPHSLRNKVGRTAWAIAWALFFRPSPRLLFSWRRLILRCFGAKVGQNARIDPSARIWAPWNLEIGDEASIAHDVDCYCVDQIRIGDHATISQYAFLCSASHDVSDPHMRLVTAPIDIGSGAWICAKAFLGPGVAVGDGGVVGAQAVTFRDVLPWTIVAGNPAKQIGTRRITTGARGTGTDKTPSHSEGTVHL